jgi:hypothetical protein
MLGYTVCSVPGFVARAAQGHEVSMVVAPGGNLVPGFLAPVVLAVMDLQSFTSATVAASTTIPRKDLLSLAPPFRPEEHLVVACLVEFHSLGPLMGQRETSPVQAICTDYCPPRSQQR